MSNPLMAADELPRFSQILPEQAEPAIREIIADNRQQLEALLERGEGYTWDNLLKPLERMENRLGRAFAPVSHLNAVCNSEAWRNAYNACLMMLSDYATDLGQNEKLYQAIEAVTHSEEFKSYMPAQIKVVENMLRDFRLAGVALPPEQKQRYKAIAQELAQLTARFQDQVLDATQAWKKHILDAQALAGLPESGLAQLRQNAANEGLEGYLLKLDFPSYQPVIMHAHDAVLRREIYEAYATRASDQGPQAGQWDNTPVMAQILALRHEGAQLLGFANYAEESLATKMAPDVATVERFLLDLAAHAKPVAEQEMAELREFARVQDGKTDLQSWDIPYYSEWLQRERYQLTQDELRPYFPAPRVLQGLFAIVQKLYGLQIEEIAQADVWHPQVRLFELRDRAGELRGKFYTDLYARPHKRGGAWMDNYTGRLLDMHGLQLPVAFLVCNFTPPLGDKPALLTHDEVLTLFHEFGHGLHHLLTRVDHLAVSGINGVAWDAVELPSQFMENFCWQRESLDLISGHMETGEPVPEVLHQRMLAARNFQSGMQMLRQIEFALFDLRVHRDYRPGEEGYVQRVLDEVRSEVAVVTPPPWNRFAHSFTHIFAGGYAAGYYSYKWAEVLSADAFSAFEEQGVFDPRVGLHFMQTILEQGGARDAAELFREFRGREPSIEPLLRHSGIPA